MPCLMVFGDIWIIYNLYDGRVRRVDDKPDKGVGEGNLDSKLQRRDRAYHFRAEQEVE